MTFSSFSHMIQALFGFDFPGLEWTMVACSEDDGWDEPRQMLDYRLGEPEAFPIFTCMYDFWDSWEFQIQREAIIEDYRYDYPDASSRIGADPDDDDDDFIPF